MGPRTQLTLDAHTLLTCIPLFSGLKPDLLGRLGASSRLIELPGHRSLFGIGQPINEVHYLVSGAVKRFTLRADHVESILELVQPGTPFALSESLIADRYASFAETLEPSVILAISVNTLRELAAESPALASRLLQIMARQHHDAEFNPGRYRSISVTQRVLDYLLGLAGAERDLAGETTVQLSASKRLIATRLDMAPETFSRTLRQLSDDGVIVVDRRTVHIQNATLAGAAAVAHESMPPLQYPRHERGTERDGLSPVELINLCGRNRMLSQRLTSSWILVTRNLARPGSRVALRKFRDELQRNLDRTNEVDLAEPLLKTRHALNNAWPAFVELLGRETPAAPDIQAVFRDSEQLLTLADNLTSGMVAAARMPEAKLVNIAGRNRMLCARIAKLILFSDWGVNREEAARLIDLSINEFEKNLRDILASSSKSPEALAQLKIDVDQWQNFLTMVNSVLSSAEIRNDALTVFAAGEELLRHLNTTVKIYERLARQAQGKQPDRHTG